MTPSRLRTNSADIAEERGLAIYPSATKKDGKILRPQYKEILKGSPLILKLRLSPRTIFANMLRLSL